MINEILSYFQTNWISLFGAILGILFLYLEYKANILMWVASIAMSIFYIYIFYRAQLYANTAIYIYFLIASIHGLIVWLTPNKNTNNGNAIKSIPRRIILPVLGSISLATCLIYFILLYYNYSSFLLTFGDALSTALNIVALWMLSRKWKEQWLLLIPANLITSLLFIAHKDLLSSLLFAIFCLASVAGYFHWKRLSKLPKQTI